MVIDLYRQYYNDLDNIVSKYFDKRKFRINKPYTNSIDVTGRGNGTNIWIRYEISQNGLVVNFSNIYIDENMQRSGIFTGLVREVAKYNKIYAIKIGSVLTDSMRAWCNKNKFNTDDGMDYYRIVKRRG